MFCNPFLSNIFLATSNPVRSLLFSIFLYLLYDDVTIPCAINDIINPVNEDNDDNKDLYTSKYTETEETNK